MSNVESMAMDMTIATSMKIVDMHAHILPLVDDGAKSLDEAILMIQKEIEQGASKIILTPHVQSRVTKTTREEQVEIFHQLKKKVEDLSLSIELVLGAEIFYRSHLTPDYNLYTLGDSKCLLIEFSTMIETPIEEIVYNLSRQGFIPIVAHIERYEYLKMTDYELIKRAGGYLQVNTNALLGLDTKSDRKLILKLLKLKLIDIISTDTHNLEHRRPNMKDACLELKNHVDDAYIHSLCGQKIEELLRND